jgi:hypothetical protein
MKNAHGLRGCRKSIRILTGTLTAMPVITVLAGMASCGTVSGEPGFGGSGTSSSGASSSGASGPGPGGSSGASGSGSGSLGASSGSAPGSGTSGGSSGASSGQGFSTTDAGGKDAAAPVQPCSTVGSIQTCCTAGKQTCMASGEVPVPSWGPCLDPAGTPLSCVVCGGELAPTCDAGKEAGPPPPPPSVCTDPVVSSEPKILVGYEPAMGQTVGLTGQIKVWVNDENPPFIAPGEVVDNTTGAVTTPGMRTATAADGLLDEPALYIAPQSPTNGGTPLFPQWIKGSYNNNPPARGTFAGGAPMDPPPAGAMLGAQYTGEFIWDVSKLGLALGQYTAVFSVHDGDRDRAIGCVTITINSGG